MTSRPPFIVSSGDLPERAHVYPQSSERMGPIRRAGRIQPALHASASTCSVCRLAHVRHRRLGWKKKNEEEFVYVLEGEVDAWINGDLHRMFAGDLAAFPAGTGICHCFINNSAHEALLLVGGEAPKQGSRIFYPLNPSRRTDMKASDWWDDAPSRPLGPHDGLPDALRG